MTKSIRAVKQNLEHLRSQVAETATELETLHHNYLELLSHSLKQQLILACYQICTHLYPQAFISLSLRAKQNLQQSLRQLSLELMPQLTELVAQKELEPPAVELNLMAELIKKLPKPKHRSSERENIKAEAELELVKAEIASLENLEDFENIELIAIDASSDEPEQEPENEPEESPKEQLDIENPEHLILWHRQIERGIKRNLDETSRKVNKLLQEAEIIPNRLPSKVINIAMEADGSKGMRSNSQQSKVPHVMHLAIESDKSKKNKSNSKSLQISLLRLRLAELEFSDHLLNAKRGQIRNLMTKVKQLNGKYKAIQQELAVLEAQAAWRASWYED